MGLDGALGAVTATPPRLLPLPDAARYLSVSVDTFCAWERSGLVVRVRAPLRRRLYDRVALDHLVETWAMERPDEQRDAPDPARRPA